MKLKIKNYELRLKSEDENIVAKKSFNFAIRCVNVYKHLCYKSINKEFIISKQLVRSGTSIGANIEEALGAQSTADFVAKMAIAYKEARESRYWIKLLFHTDYITETEYESLINDLNDLINIIAKIQLTTKKNNS